MQKYQMKQDVVLEKKEFNLLITVVSVNLGFYKGFIQETAEKVMTMILQMARFYKDEGNDVVSLTFYGDEAKNLVYQLIAFAHFIYGDNGVDSDCYDKMKEKVLEGRSL